MEVHYIGTDHHIYSLWFPAWRGCAWPSWGMYGTGGNKVVVFPHQEVIVVIATTNFRVAGAAALSDKLITDYILNSRLALKRSIEVRLECRWRPASREGSEMEHSPYSGPSESIVAPDQTRRHLVQICMTTVFVALVSASAWGQDPSVPPLSNLDRDIAAHADVPGLAVAVTRDSKIIYERGFGWADRERALRATPKTPFALASVSKSITATAIMQLAERGRLSLDAPVNDYLGSAKVHSPQWNAADSTVRRVMSHTGGLTTFTRWCGSDRSACNLDREIRDYGILVWRPGELFDYSNLGFGILGEIIARVSGNDYDSYLKKNIFAPLRMEDCGLKTRQPASRQYNEKTKARSPARISGTPAASGLRCSAHDLALFGIFQLKEMTNGSSILSFANLDQMHRAQPGSRGGRAKRAEPRLSRPKVAPLIHMPC